MRLIETTGALGADAGLLTTILWQGVDIMISAGLMAGGSDLFHEVAETICGGLQTIG